MHSDEELNVESYLQEVHECVSNELVDESAVPSYLGKYILNLDASNYIGHGYESEYVKIGFSARLEAEEYALNIHFELGKMGGCGRISVYEILTNNKKRR